MPGGARPWAYRAASEIAWERSKARGSWARFSLKRRDSRTIAVAMPVMCVTDVGMLVLHRGMVMLMGVLKLPLMLASGLFIPGVVVAVVGITAGWVVAVAVGMAEGLVSMSVGMVFLEQHGNAEQHGC